jgi:predicted DNA-binding protein YlxM (UPF0122 family)
MMVYDTSGVKLNSLTDGGTMDALEMTLLFDYYGDLLTPRQKMCFDLRHNQDLSLAEIAQELQVSRQGVFDNLSRAEALLRNMEEKTGCVSRDLACRKAAKQIMEAALQLREHSDPNVSALAECIASAAANLEE